MKPIKQQQNYPDAPELHLTDLDGNKISLADFNGKIVLLNFWASWCVPCKIEFPSMLRLMNEFDGDLEFIAISSDSKQEHIKKFLKKFEGKFAKHLKSDNLHIIWDKDKKISQDQFNAIKLPETIIISPQGKMVRKIIGEEKWDSDEMIDYLNSLRPLS